MPLLLFLSYVYIESVQENIPRVVQYQSDIKQELSEDGLRVRCHRLQNNFLQGRRNQVESGGADSD